MDSSIKESFVKVTALVRHLRKSVYWAKNILESYRKTNDCERDLVAWEWALGQQ